jgi:hypothetical protein
MEVRLGNELRFNASHVPFDSLGELTSALLRFLESRRVGIARFNCEPEEFALAFEPGRAPGSLRLRMNDWSHECEARQIGLIIWRAMLRLESRFEPGHWMHEFPTKNVAQLRALLEQ